MKINRIIAIILCAVLCLTMAFSAAFIAIEADHDCTHEQCSVCLQIEICVSLLSSTGLIVICFFAFLFTKRVTARAARMRHIPVKEASLILAKVKLSN